ncbi:MAG: filamentous hemagglutinin N-terminal domain-containing protein [Cyanobacteria bacterium J06643_13]
MALRQMRSLMVTCTKFNLIFIVLISTCCWNYLISGTFAQIVPDETLGSESSIVTPDLTLQDALVDYLAGGAVRGNNLFHSFSEFNIPEAGKAYFATPSGIENILTRVTGSSATSIQGTLGVDGNANLFLLNPNGIIFGQNSQLDIAGSFLATTADSYILQNDFEFSAVNPQAPPLLTVDLPVGLQFGSAPGSIVNHALVSAPESFPADNLEVVETDLNEITEGLRVATGKTLSLLGGEIRLEGGYLNSTEGKIELGAVGADSRVGLNSNSDPNYPSWVTDYQAVNDFADINISAGGGIDGGDTGKSQISLTGKNISLGYDWAALAESQLQPADFFTLEPLGVLDELAENKAQIVAHNDDNPVSSKIEIFASDTFSIIDPSKGQENILAHTIGTGSAGTINVIADTIITYGASLESWTLAGAKGDSGEINLTANNTSVQYGGAGVNTFSPGRGGKIKLNIASDAVIKSGGFGAETRYQGAEQDAGAGGTVEVAAENLRIVAGGIGTGTFGSGTGGSINLKIAQNLIIESGGFGADAHSSGDGGEIIINAQNIELKSAGLGANTWGSGIGGKIVINAKTISFQDGVIGAESGQNIDERDFVVEDAIEITGKRNAGNGGSIYINAQSLSIDNSNITTSTFGTGDAGNLVLNVGTIEAVGGELLTGVNSTTNGAGRGGNITVNGDRLRLSEGATIAANSTSRGQAGDIKIEAQDLLQLNSKGTISVDGGRSGLPGNINIQGRDLTLNNGKISATTNLGRRGNISLVGEQLFLEDRSQIITNAGKDATGGDISIDLKYHLLSVDRSEITASAEQGQGGNIQIDTRGIFISNNSKINVSSQFGIDGLIRVDTLATDHDSDLIELPHKLIDSSRSLSRRCSSNSENIFANIGRGGLPNNPLTSLSQNHLLEDFEVFAPLDNAGGKSVPVSVEPIIEAKTWKINHHGLVELVAEQNQILLQESLVCNR